MAEEAMFESNYETINISLHDYCPVSGSFHGDASEHLLWRTL